MAEMNVDPDEVYAVLRNPDVDYVSDPHSRAE
jgi:hypothetical protein